MVWCPIHNRYIKGRKDKQNHIKKYDCSFIENYRVDRKPKKKYNNRNPTNKNPELLSKYLWNRERHKRSQSRTNIKKGKKR